jgi:quinohemoprotein ethanol dehydrogenase
MQGIRGEAMQIRNVMMVLFVAAIAACGKQQSERQEESHNAESAMTAASAPASTVDADIRAMPSRSLVAEPSVETEEGEWILHGHSLGEQRHAPFKKINTSNAKRVGLAFAYEDFLVRGQTHRGLEATPLMDDGVLYFTGPWSVVYAVDARTGEEKWIFDPGVDGAHARVTCCDVVNRGLALKGDRVFVGTIDGYLIAINKVSGEEIWRTDTFVARPTAHSITGAPRLAGDLVVIGSGGAEMGVRGYVSAFNIDDGSLAWRFFTVPGAGPDETPDVTAARKTWSESMAWEYGGGGTVWDSMTYDAELGLLYVGVGNGGPWPAWARSDGERLDNLYLSSIVAIDVDTGLAKWHYQTTPGDSWDYTATQHMVLADIEWAGARRKVIMQAPKNGFFYVLDRETGELLAADPYVAVSWAERIDLETGRPVFTENADYSIQPRVITPAPGGGHNWPPMAYNGETGLVYIPILEHAARYSNDDDGKGYLTGARNVLARSQMPNKEEDAALLEGLPAVKLQSRVIAWDPIAKEERWTSAPQPIGAGGLLSTAGGLVIGGTSGGVLNFFDATTGRLVHSIETGTQIMAAPIAYELDGVQYVAVLAGGGGVGLRAFAPGFAGRTYENYERLLVYRLNGGETPRPPPVQALPVTDIPPDLPGDADTLALGQYQYERHCIRCHSRRGAPSGYPDLWNMHPTTDAIFDQIVLDGVRSFAGMAGFGDILNPEDTMAIRAYIAADRKAKINGENAVRTDVH